MINPQKFSKHHDFSNQYFNYISIKNNASVWFFYFIYSYHDKIKSLLEMRKLKQIIEKRVDNLYLLWRLLSFAGTSDIKPIK